MIPEKYKEIVALLLTRTREGAVNWMSSRPGEFVVHFDNFSLAISGMGGGSGRSIACNLYNGEGDLIDQFEAHQGTDAYAQLDELHTAARRKAYRVDEALSALKHELVAGGTVGRSDKS